MLRLTFLENPHSWDLSCEERSVYRAFAWDCDTFSKGSLRFTFDPFSARGIAKAVPGIQSIWFDLGPETGLI